MKFDGVRSFAKSLCKRIAAGIHSFTHPNERHEHLQQEYSLAVALAEARQSEAHANRCANQFKDRAHQSEELAQLYKDRVRLEQWRHAEEVRISENRGFKNGYERGHTDSAYYRDRPIYNEGHMDEYAARVDDEQRRVVHESDKNAHGGPHDEQLHGEIQFGDNSKETSSPPRRFKLIRRNIQPGAIQLGDNSKEMGSPPRRFKLIRRNIRPGDMQLGDNSNSNNRMGETPHGHHLHGSREMGSPPHRFKLFRRNGKHPNSQSSHNPFFPCHGDMM